MKMIVRDEFHAQIWESFMFSLVWEQYNSPNYYWIEGYPVCKECGSYHSLTTA